MTVRAIKIKGEQLSFLAHADSSEQLITGTVTGETPTGWNFKVKGTYAYWVDNDGAEQRAQGTLTGGSRTYRSVKVKGETLLYGDITGAERSLSAAVEVGASKDNYINAHWIAQGNNYSTLTFMGVTNYLGELSELISLISFDVSALSGTIISATLRLTLFSVAGIGNTHWVYKLLHNDWVEAESSFNNKSTGVTWTSGDFSASDYTTNDGASAVVPASGYVDWDITALVQDAIDSSINLNIAVMGVSPEIAGPTYRTKEHATVATRPKLIVIE